MSYLNQSVIKYCILTICCLEAYFLLSTSMSYQTIVKNNERHLKIEASIHSNSITPLQPTFVKGLLTLFSITRDIVINVSIQLNAFLKLVISCLLRASAMLVAMLSKLFDSIHHTACRGYQLLCSSYKKYASTKPAKPPSPSPPPTPIATIVEPYRSIEVVAARGVLSTGPVSSVTAVPFLDLSSMQQEYQQSSAGDVSPVVKKRRLFPFRISRRDKSGAATVTADSGAPALSPSARRRCFPLSFTRRSNVEEISPRSDATATSTSVAEERSTEVHPTGCHPNGCCVM